MTAHVLPPLAIDVMRATGTALGIDATVLTASSVPEAPPAAYNAGTTYAAAAQASTGTAGGVISVWTSLQASNTGNTPASSPLWWKLAGTTYAEYSGAVTYAAGDLVLSAAAHMVYSSAVAGNLGNALTDGTKWTLVGPSSRYAAFYMTRPTGLVGAVSPATMVLAPGLITSLVVLQPDADTLRIQVVSASVTKLDETVALDGTVINDGDDYCFKPFALQPAVTRLNLPSYSDAVITLTFTKSSGLISVPKIVLGNAVSLGNTQRGPRVRRKNFNLVERDTYGVITRIQALKSVPLVSQRTWLEKADVRAARAALDALGPMPGIFVGLSNDEDDYADLLTLLAMCLDYDMTLDPDSDKDITRNAMELEGV